MSWRNYSRYFPTSTPRRVEGGIKAQSQRGSFGQRWWAKRWVNILEQTEMAQRLNRGRAYARGGQVISIEIHHGQIIAVVQGTAKEPYTVTITVKTLETAEWDKVIDTLKQQALFAAKLMAGEMPHEIEDVFQSVGLNLFPQLRYELTNKCSCPDWSNPCKHIAAVFYLIGEEFDRDPFLIFKLRGMDRETLVTRLGQGNSQMAFEDVVKLSEIPETEPLSMKMVEFWSGSTLPEDFYGEVKIPGSSATLLRRLGSFPFWRGDELPLESLPPIYPHASKVGMRVFLGEDDDNGGRK
jgi:uncharacterized Zn finger protein